MSVHLCLKEEMHFVKPVQKAAHFEEGYAFYMNANKRFLVASVCDRLTRCNKNSVDDKKRTKSIHCYNMGVL